MCESPRRGGHGIPRSEIDLHLAKSSDSLINRCLGLRVRVRQVASGLEELAGRRSCGDVVTGIVAASEDFARRAEHRMRHRRSGMPG